MHQDRVEDLKAFWGLVNSYISAGDTIHLPGGPANVALF